MPASRTRDGDEPGSRAPDRKPRLHLVRHGESTWNAAGRLQGRTAHVPLTPLGLEQARAAADLLAGALVGAVWSSDQLRCRQTAELIAARHCLPIRTTPALREQAHGIWEGGSSDACEPQLLAAPPDWAPPGGETGRALHRRAAQFLRSLPAPGCEPSDVVVVSHGETIRALLAVLEGLPPERMPRELPGSGEVRTTGRRTVWAGTHGAAVFPAGLTCGAPIGDPRTGAAARRFLSGR